MKPSYLDNHYSFYQGFEKLLEIHLHAAMMLLLMFLLNVWHFHTAECSSVIHNTETPARVPAMYIFGDSLNDVGNCYGANYPPYGINFPQGPTGRFSDGKVFPDFIAEYLGLPYPPAYSSASKKPIPSEIGYNYACAGCSILPVGGLPGCWVLEDQINYFQKTVKEELEPKFKSPEELYQHLANSLIIIWAGSNDYILNYFEDKTPEHDPEEFAQLLVDILSEKLQVLYKLGVRKALVMELGLLGCTPQARGLRDETWCDETKNQNATIFNKKLAYMMQTLASSLSDSHFSLGKIYDLSEDAFNNPAKYGFTNVGSACCATILIGSSCVPCLPGICFPLAGKPEEFLFWDGVHPSQASVSNLANACINGSSVCVPLNLQQLVQVQINPNALVRAT